MGNSNGNIDEYWEAIDNTSGLQGGFICDWVDQGLLKEGVDGKKHWAYGADHVISSAQVQLPPKRELNPRAIRPTSGVVRTEKHGELVRIILQYVSEIMLNAQTGRIESWKVQGTPAMSKGIRPCFWRAPTDNDKGGGADSYLSKWKASFLDDIVFITKSCVLRNKNDFPEIVIVYHGIPKAESGSEPKESNIIFTVHMTYSIYNSGDVIIDTCVNPSSGLPPLPQIGVEFHLDKTLDRVRWYGKGSFECYPDKKSAAQVAIHKKTVREMHVPYIVPGECGGRADVRWLTLQNIEGVGIYASTYGSSPPMQISASYYLIAELDRATHEGELVEGDDIEVHLDHKHMGIGGDDS